MSDDEERGLNAIELIRELAADPDEVYRTVRLWVGGTDCVVTGVRYYRAHAEMRLDIEYVNRKQVEGHD